MELNFDRLWAPWRLEYVTGAESTAPPLEPIDWRPGADHNCFLCRAAASYAAPADADRALMVAQRGSVTMVVLNRFPYNNGHLLVSPLRHVGDLSELSQAEHTRLYGVIVTINASLSRPIECRRFQHRPEFGPSRRSGPTGPFALAPRSSVGGRQ